MPFSSSGDEEQVLLLERFQLGERLIPLQHAVAQRAAHLLEQRRPTQEPQLPGREAGQILRLEVVPHLTVAAARVAQRPCSPVAARPAHPSVRSTSSANAASESRTPAALSSSSASRRVNARSEAPTSDSAGRAPQPRHQHRLDSTRKHDRGALGDVAGQNGQHLQRVSLGNLLEIVEHQHTVLQAKQPAPRHRERLFAQIDAPSSRASSFRSRWSTATTSSIAATTCREKHDRVVVAPIERDPAERTIVTRGPLREQRRLAVPGRRNDRNRPCGPGRAKPVHERRPRDRSRPRGRRTDLRRSHGERKPAIARLGQDSLHTETTGERHRPLSATSTEGFNPSRLREQSTGGKLLI